VQTEGEGPTAKRVQSTVRPDAESATSNVPVGSKPTMTVPPQYRDGMLDGTPLDVAIRQVDEVSPPTWFALSYVHPDVGARAVNGPSAELDRLREVKGLLTW
jgi:hypothetical protein